MKWAGVLGAAVALGACGLRALSVEECERLGGRLVADPGDGSTSREGCPEGEARLGEVEFGIEGGICCRQ